MLIIWKKIDVQKKKKKKGGGDNIGSCPHVPVLYSRGIPEYLEKATDKLYHINYNVSNTPHHEWDSNSQL